MPQPKSAKDLTVLIVDDSKFMLTTTGRMFNELGFTNLVYASSGDTALNMFSTNNIDLVITDWHMPGLTGIKFLEILKKNEKTAKIPIILLTTEGHKEKISNAIKMGADNYIVKPLKKEVLHSKLINMATKFNWTI